MRLLFLCLIVFCLKASSQNLLANGQFDDKNICIEYRSGCAPEAWFRIPLSPVAISAETHNQFVSLVMENVFEPLTQRSLIYTRLLCPLIPGKKYIFKGSFRPNEGQFDHIDVVMVPFEPGRNVKYLSTARQKFTITQQQRVQVSGNNWGEYSFEFIAKGYERYFVIGNFSKQALIADQPDETGKVRYDIDNVSLLPQDSTQLACPEWKTNKFVLYQNNSRHTPDNFLDDEPPYSPPVEYVPVIPPPAPVVNDTLVIPDVLFKFNSAELNPQFAKGIDSVISKIKTRVFKNIEVIGHTDSLGTHAFNIALSLHRAETVKNYLAQKLQYPLSSITANGKAAMVPVASNKTPAGRQKNRRVEIVLVR